MNEFDADTEFDRQVQTLLSKGYSTLADQSGLRFRELLEPLRKPVLERASTMTAPTEDRVPFVLVVTRALVPIEESVPLTTLAGKQKPGVIERYYKPGELDQFVALKSLSLPDEAVYVVFDVDRGEEFCGVVPLDAMAAVAARHRTGLTMEEGIALLTHFPASLAKNKCYSLSGTRLGEKDKRVPALWISKGAPKLGWCWEGNPHSWLGLASAGSRAGAVSAVTSP
ncbi:DUF5701 family protein [Streptomyces candidus]|uniref:Uncharacterized protein n=1 Tax=Streptomyces candidus TaxID=67283 RepID=A0A7X0HIC6_9ACTN|nr:DUF5701 family protein [Streptomyces candidus]MBB6438219.1 hypothetical protein [Streptomyces candidus]GHH51584.1 hypothetical protein GCM10018773_50220 [Streptomyces candidus]